MGVEVAQVGGRNGAELLEESQRSPACSASASPWCSISSGSTSRPPTRTRRTQVRWLSPTWSTITLSGAISRRRATWRCTPIATLQRPIARCPASRSARVTIPTGFVKSTIHASGRASERTRSAISSTTGTVRIAFANPPAPVVSWPMHPHASGIVSSRASPPARRPAAGAARTTPPRPRRRGRR